MKQEVLDLGVVEYQEALKVQKQMFDRVRDRSLTACLILCQHHPVITVGRQGRLENLKVSLHELTRRGIPVYPVERGGDLTYHGPGQITVYPIIHLSYFKKDIHYFLRCLEESAMSVFRDFGVCACQRQGLTGVWVGNKKISSIGVTVKNWISFHGISMNIYQEDTANFSLIRPCGMDIEITSLDELIAPTPDIVSIKKSIIRRFAYA